MIGLEYLNMTHLPDYSLSELQSPLTAMKEYKHRLSQPEIEVLGTARMYY